MNVRDLSVLLAADPSWRIIPGMGVESKLDIDDEGYIDGGTAGSVQSGSVQIIDDFGCQDFESVHFLLPNLDHPGTLGCLAFTLIPEVWGSDWTVVIVGSRVTIWRWDGNKAIVGFSSDSTITLGENLALAFLAAPGPLGSKGVQP